MPGPEDEPVAPASDSLPPPPEGGTDNPAAMTASTSTGADVEKGEPPLPSPPPQQPRNQRGCCKNRTLLEKCLFVFLLLIFLLFLAFLIGFVILYFWKSESKQFCTDDRCVDAAARMNSFIDRTANPCEDFYQYACGGWIRDSIIPDDKPEVTIYSNMETYVKGVLKKLLEAPNKHSDLPAVQKVRDFYASCTNTERLEALGDGPLTRLAVEVGRWPSLDSAWNETDFLLSEVLVRLSRVRSLHLLPLISVDVKPGVEDRTVHALYVGQGHVDLHHVKSHKENHNENPQDKGLRVHPEGLELFRRSLEDLLRELGVDSATARQDAQDVADFKLQLAEISLPKHQVENPNLHEVTTLADLEKRYRDFDWTYFLNGVVQYGSMPLQVTPADRITLTATAYLDKLFPLLNKTSDRVVGNYLLSTTLWHYVNYLSPAFRHILDDYNKEVKGHGAQSRWEMCVELADKLFPEVTGRLFVQSSFGQDQRDSIISLVATLKTVLMESIRQVEWMTDASKQTALDKAHALQAKIGYPDYIMDNLRLSEIYAKHNVSREAFFQNMLHVNFVHNWNKVANFRQPVVPTNKWSVSAAKVKAYYDDKKNQLVFPAGFVQPPVYAAEYPRSINYGGIGSFIGREMTHGFDERGGQYDKRGEERWWWSADDKERYERQAECMVDHYSCFRWKPARMNIDGYRTLIENIADNAGLKYSYKAYRGWVEKKGIEERPLPGLNLTHNQLFFISFAQLWCTNDREEYKVHKIKTDSFTLAPFRVLGTLQNSEEFARAFNCPTGSRMNPEKKCKVW